MSATSVLVFDKTNSASDYNYIAIAIDSGKDVIGNIVVEQPWYSPKSAWTYWMYSNAYGDGGCCGGAVDLGFSRVPVKPDTIRLFTQIEKIKYFLRQDMQVALAKTSNDCVNGKYFCTITKESEIPYEMWEN